MKTAFLRIIYIIRVSFLHLKGNIKLQLVSILCLIMGLLLPFVMGANYDEMLQGLQISTLKNVQNTFMVWIKVDELTDQDMEDIKKEVNLTNLSYTQTYECKIEYQNGFNDLNIISAVTICKDNITDFIRYQLLDGRFFNTKDYLDKEKVCIVERHIADERSIKIDDHIKLNGESFRVIGIIRNSAFTILVPTGVIELDKSDNGMKLYCQTSERELSASTITSGLTKVKQNIEVINMVTASENMKITQSQMKMVITRQLPSILITLTFALSNMICVLVGKLQRQKKSFMIKRALGASNKQVFIELFSENMIIMISACAFLILCFPIIKIIMSPIFYDLTIAGYAVLIMVLSGVAITILVSIILYLYIIRLKIAGGIRGET